MQKIPCHCRSDSMTMIFFALCCQPLFLLDLINLIKLFFFTPVTSLYADLVETVSIKLCYITFCGSELLCCYKLVYFYSV